MTEQVRLEAGYNLAGRRVMIGLPSYDYKVSSKLGISLAEFVYKQQDTGLTFISVIFLGVLLYLVFVT